MPEKSLQDWLTWLETLSPREIVLGLTRVQEVLGRLDLRRPGYVVQIAGTNGKGSCAAMLEAILLRSGERTGCYTSPHLCSYNERIRIDGQPADDHEIVAAFKRVEAARGELPLTYFEFGTLAALSLFHERDVTAAILEVGMGGRLDAVNAVEPDGGIITSIALDHQAWLGQDIESIAREKAGIMRSGKPLIFASRQVPDAIVDKAAETSADLRILGRDYDFEAPTRNSWNFTGRNVELRQLSRPAPRSDIQVQNAAAVLALLETSGNSAWLQADTLNAAFSGLQLPGRMQLLQAGHTWLLDVAHNVAAAEQLARSLVPVKGRRRVTAIVSALGDKDVSGMVSPLCPLVDRWIAVGADAARAIPVTELAAAVANTCARPCLIAESLPAAMRAAEDMTAADDLILVAGSFYVVGPVLDELYSRRTGE